MIENSIPKNLLRVLKAVSLASGGSKIWNLSYKTFSSVASLWVFLFRSGLLWSMLKIVSVSVLAPETSGAPRVCYMYVLRLYTCNLCIIWQKRNIHFFVDHSNDIHEVLGFSTWMPVVVQILGDYKKVVTTAEANTTTTHISLYLKSNWLRNFIIRWRNTDLIDW